jgi:hypothetical protein
MQHALWPFIAYTSFMWLFPSWTTVFTCLSSVRQLQLLQRRWKAHHTGWHQRSLLEVVTIGKPWFFFGIQHCIVEKGKLHLCGYFFKNEEEYECNLFLSKRIVLCSWYCKFYNKCRKVLDKWQQPGAPFLTDILLFTNFFNSSLSYTSFLEIVVYIM